MRELVITNHRLTDHHMNCVSAMELAPTTLRASAREDLSIGDHCARELAPTTHHLTDHCANCASAMELMPTTLHASPRGD